ncbi:MAG: tetratricopeptide repeat protein [Ignavibacteriales bacterium]|nr:tetratricopeptide repeat protein [Ignavibacteriales bacterium]
MRTLIWILGASLFVMSCKEERLRLPDLQEVRAKHDRTIDSLERHLSQDPLNRQLVLEFGKASLSKSRFELELGFTGWTVVYPKLVEGPLLAALPPLERILMVDTTSADLYALSGQISLELWRMKQLISNSEHSPLKGKASKALSRALALDSVHVEAMLHLARLVPLYGWRVGPSGEPSGKQSDELWRAEELTRKAIQLSPENGMAYLRRAQILAQLSGAPRMSSAKSDELYGNAIMAYRKAIELGIDDASAYAHMAGFFRWTQLEGNFKRFNNTFGFVPGFIKGFVLAGLELMKMSGGEKAGRLASKALELNTLFPAALMIQCDSYISQGKKEKAIECFLQATLLNPSAGGSYYVGRSSFAREVIATSPKSYVAYGRLGALLLNSGEEQPIPYIKRALEIKPDYAQGWILLGRAYEQLNLIAEADTAYQKALSLPWDNSLNLHWTQLFYEKQKQFDKVVTVVEREIAEGMRDSSWAYWSLGSVFEGAGELSVAERYYTRALRSSDPYLRTVVAGSLSRAYVRKKEFDRAILTLQRILDPSVLDEFQQSEVFLDMGSVYSAQGNSSKAIEAYENAIALQPDVAAWHFLLGKELLKLRQQEKALEHFQRAAELGLPAARDTLQSLQKGK